MSPKPTTGPTENCGAGSSRLDWSTLMRHAHSLAINNGRTPSVVREIVARSWRRSRAAGVDPDAAAPRILDDAAVARELEDGPLGMAIRDIEAAVLSSLTASPQLVAFADRRGTLLWVKGHPRAMRSAEAPGFLPGFSCLEGSIGTNAIGTCLALDGPLQIFAAEHFSRRLHDWACAAAPIHDPTTGRLAGAVNVSGGWRVDSPQNLVVARLLAHAAESALRLRAVQEEERLRQTYVSKVGRPVPRGVALIGGSGRVVLAGDPSWLGRHAVLDSSGAPISMPDGELLVSRQFANGYLSTTSDTDRRDTPAQLSVEPRGDRRIVATVDGVRCPLPPRLSELLVLLAMHPGGLSADDLESMLYSHPVEPVTLRADLSRLRRAIGPVVRREPLRLDVHVLDSSACLSVLEGSSAPGLVARTSTP